MRPIGSADEKQEAKNTVALSQNARLAPKKQFDRKKITEPSTGRVEQSQKRNESASAGGEVKKLY